MSATLVAPGQTLVAPGHTTVIPLEPEFITPQDGHDKQDCEIAAARRWLTAHGRRYAPWQPIYLGDDLVSRQPRCEAVRATGGHFVFFVFVCKPSSHPLIQEYPTGSAVPEVTQTLKRGRQRFTCRYRWLCEVPLRDSKDALLVNWLEIEIRNAAGAVTYRNSFITDLPVDRTNVAEVATCGRARWKIENETFRDLQCPHDQWLPSRTQFRPWQGSSVHGTRVLEPAGVRFSYRL